MKILLVAGARPNFMKIAPIMRQLAEHTGGGGAHCSWKLIHTGQHYDYDMSKVFFEELGIPEPDHFLNAGSGSHAHQTARVMVAFEEVCRREKPDVVVVVGDVNSTLACSITAKKLNIGVAHVEAGLRSGDMTMPEEINRMVTDAVADQLFVTEKSGIENLKREGKKEEIIHFVGNVMIDTLYYQLEKLKSHPLEKTLGDDGRPYAVVTLHRPSNVDDWETFKGIIEALVRISGDMGVVFPAHPRTRKMIEEFGFESGIGRSGIRIIPPMAYMPFLNLWKDAALVLTDSGGLQEETTALGIPCFTIRENTERPVTIHEGTNTLVGTKKEGILAAYEKFRKGEVRKGRVPALWDGHAAERIIKVLGSGLHS